MRRLITIAVALAVLAGLAADTDAAGPCVGSKRVVCLGVASGAAPPPSSCNGTIDLSSGCAQPMFGGL